MGESLYDRFLPEGAWPGQHSKRRQLQARIPQPQAERRMSRTSQNPLPCRSPVPAMTNRKQPTLPDRGKKREKVGTWQKNRYYIFLCSSNKKWADNRWVKLYFVHTPAVFFLYVPLDSNGFIFLRHCLCWTTNCQTILILYLYYIYFYSIGFIYATVQHCSDVFDVKFFIFFTLEFFSFFLFSSFFSSCKLWWNLMNMKRLLSARCGEQLKQVQLRFIWTQGMSVLTAKLKEYCLAAVSSSTQT